VESGKIAEHWDTIEPIAPKENWKHQNGKTRSIGFFDEEATHFSLQIFLMVL